MDSNDRARKDPEDPWQQQNSQDNQSTAPDPPTLSPAEAVQEQQGQQAEEQQQEEQPQESFLAPRPASLTVDELFDAYLAEYNAAVLQHGGNNFAGMNLPPMPQGMGQTLPALPRSPSPTIGKLLAYHEANPDTFHTAHPNAPRLGDAIPANPEHPWWADATQPGPSTQKTPRQDTAEASNSAGHVLDVMVANFIEENQANIPQPVSVPAQTVEDHSANLPEDTPAHFPVPPGYVAVSPPWFPPVPAYPPSPVPYAPPYSAALPAPNSAGLYHTSNPVPDYAAPAYVPVGLTAYTPTCTPELPASGALAAYSPANIVPERILGSRSLLHLDEDILVENLSEDVVYRKEQADLTTRHEAEQEQGYQRGAYGHQNPSNVALASKRAREWDVDSGEEDIKPPPPKIQRVIGNLNGSAGDQEMLGGPPTLIQLPDGQVVIDFHRPRITVQDYRTAATILTAADMPVPAPVIATTEHHDFFEAPQPLADPSPRYRPNVYVAEPGAQMWTLDPVPSEPAQPDLYQSDPNQLRVPAPGPSTEPARQAPSQSPIAAPRPNVDQPVPDAQLSTPDPGQTSQTARQDTPRSSVASLRKYPPTDADIPQGLTLSQIILQCPSLVHERGILYALCNSGWTGRHIYDLMPQSHTQHYRGWRPENSFQQAVSKMNRGKISVPEAEVYHPAPERRPPPKATDAWYKLLEDWSPGAGVRARATDEKRKQEGGLRANRAKKPKTVVSQAPTAANASFSTTPRNSFSNAGTPQTSLSASGSASPVAPPRRRRLRNGRPPPPIPSWPGTPSSAAPSPAPYNLTQEDQAQYTPSQDVPAQYAPAYPDPAYTTGASGPDYTLQTTMTYSTPGPAPVATYAPPDPAQEARRRSQQTAAWAGYVAADSQEEFYDDPRAAKWDSGEYTHPDYD